MAQGSCSLLGAIERPSFSSQMQANATPTSADACLSIVHSLMCHRQVTLMHLRIIYWLLKQLFGHSVHNFRGYGQTVKQWNSQSQKSV